eukprot:3991956-Pyramimonas_sp.AAC.1
MTSPTTSCVLVFCASSLFLAGFSPSRPSLVWVPELSPIWRQNIPVSDATRLQPSAFTSTTN